MKNVNGRGIYYRALNDNQCEEIVNAVYQLLETTGCVVQNARARALLGKAGCRIKGERVYISPSLMKWAVDAAPSSVTLYDRNGMSAMEMAAGQCYFGPPITTVYVTDLETGEKRRATKADAVNAALVCDALPNVAWASAMSAVGDGIASLTDVYEVHALLPNTKKPIMYWATCMDNLRYEFEMFEAVAGSLQAFQEKPFSIALICPMDPLIHTEEGVEQIMYLAKREAPVVYIAGVAFGGSSPITMAGSMVVGLADTLVGLLISQLVKEGAPFVVSKYTDNLDMATVTVGRSHPELIVTNAATADVFRYLDLPFSLNLGDTDSGFFDQVATFDISMQVYTALLCASNMNMSIGGFESCNLSNLIGLVFGDEIIEFMKPLIKGVEVSSETLALDVIDKVGPGGNFLMEEQTFIHCRDFWQPGAFHARTLAQWREENKKDMAEILKEKVKVIIAQGPQNPLTAEVQDKLNAIMARAEEGSAN